MKKFSQNNNFTNQAEQYIEVISSNEGIQIIITDIADTQQRSYYDINDAIALMKCIELAVKHQKEE